MERLKITIVKPLQDLNLLPLRKKTFPSLNRMIFALLPTLLLASLLGTYLDLYFVGKGIYAFPKRPLADIFSIHIAFTLVILPIIIFAFLVVGCCLSLWQRSIFILLLSLLMSAGEKGLELVGLFVHQASWLHLYSFFGYNLFLSSMFFFYSLYIRLISCDK